MSIEDVTEIVPEVATITPFQKLVLSIGEIPTNYLDSMSYAEQVTWFCMFLQQKVLPVVDQHSEKILEIINYLNNLDLQDEVNNKLDEMAESGELDQIIEQYLNSSAIWGFDNVADMQAATNLINGSYAKTLGYYEKNDNGGATYKVRTITNDDVVDNVTIIPLHDDSLIAELIIGDYVTPEQFGAKGDGITDDTSKFINALNHCKHIKSDYTKIYYIKDLELSGKKLEDIIFTGINKSVNGINLKGSNYINHCRFRQFNKAIYTDNSVFSEINGCTLEYNNYGIYCDVHEANHSINQLKILNSYFVKHGTDVDDMSGASTPDTGYGVYLNGWFDGCLISGNVFEYNSFTGIYLINPTNTYQCGACIIGNYFEGNRDSAIYMEGQYNRVHFIHITGNYYSSSSVNIRNTKYINVVKIFRTNYDICDEYPITVYLNNFNSNYHTIENHRYTINYGSSQYLQWINVKSLPMHRYLIRATLLSDLNVADQNATSTTIFTIKNGDNDILISGQPVWYLRRALAEGESFTIVQVD